MKLISVAVLVSVLIGCSTSETTRTSNAPPPPATFEQAVAQFNQRRPQAVLNTPPADEAKWGALKVGMSEEEVSALLGKPSGANFTRIEDPTGHAKLKIVWRYTYDKGTTVRSMTFEQQITPEKHSGKLTDWTGKK